MSNENKALIHRLIDEVWNQRKLDILDELVAPDAVIHDLSRGPEGAKEYVRLFWAAFPDFQVTTDDMVAEGDKVALRWSAHGTHQGRLMGIEPTGTANDDNRAGDIPDRSRSDKGRLDQHRCLGHVATIRSDPFVPTKALMIRGSMPIRLGDRCYMWHDRLLLLGFWPIDFARVQATYTP
ncbi:MAG: ester cyclase [bacterium]